MRSRRGRLRRWVDRRRTLFQVRLSRPRAWVPLFAYWALDGAGLDITSTAYLLVVGALVFTALAIWVECLAAYRPRSRRRTLGAGIRPRARSSPPICRTRRTRSSRRSRRSSDRTTTSSRSSSPTTRPRICRSRTSCARSPFATPLRSHARRLEHVQGPERQRRAHSCHRHVRRRVRRRSPPGARLLPPRLAMAVERRRRRAGALRRAERPTASSRSSWRPSSRRSTGSPTPAGLALHGFGIFGGSNGYWRTATLKETRLRSFMLTEDIDSSMRVLAEGGWIVSDPGLVSTELAPESWRALWGQRLRWAQGGRRCRGAISGRPSATTA